MTAEELWARYREKSGVEAEMEAWAFGGEGDALAALVLAGKKTATSSALPLYALEGEAPPAEGDYSVLLDSRGRALCVLRDRRVLTLPFREVGEELAAQEGEGDGSLAHWREVHRAFFTEELAGAGLRFTEDMPVLFEEFELLFRPEESEEENDG